MINVVFAPGMLCNEKIWQLTLPFLNPKFNCIFADFNKCVNLEDFQNAINDKTPEEGCHLIGFSLGGYASLQFSLANSPKIKSLTLVSVSSEGLSDKEKELRHRLVNFIDNMKYHRMSPNRINQFVYKRNIDKTPTLIIREMEKEMGTKTLVNQMRATTDRPSLTNQLKQLAVPTTLIAATEDKIMDVKHMRMMADKIHYSRFYSIENTGHMIPLEEPKQLAILLNKLLENQSN
ncbi:MAG: alpha/beta hydrolase [Emcibacteraceae bacterium]|nr:alpha/beta hydrolase [Emcibacteraceae bacterium]